MIQPTMMMIIYNSIIRLRCNRLSIFRKTLSRDERKNTEIYIILRRRGGALTSKALGSIG